MDELKAQYASLMTQYNQLAKDTLENPNKMDENVAKIIAINTKISTVLDEMISILTLAKSSGSHMLLYRDELIQKLEKIQSEYNGLARDSDKLETLRRIRAFQDDSWKSTLRIYLFAFLAIASLVGIIIMFKKSTQIIDMTAAMPTSAVAMPALT